MTVTYIGDDLPNVGAIRHRQLRGLAAVVVHRFGWVGDERWSYPSTEAECKRAHLPWVPALVGETYNADPFEVARFFREIYGWRHPYTFQVYGGVAYQTAPLNVITPHAGRWNRTTIGLLVTGDHRETAPPEEDIDAAADLAAHLCLWRDWHPSGALALPGTDRPVVTRVLGHDDLPAGGTATPGKECPGRHLDLGAFRSRVADRVAKIEAAPPAPGLGIVVHAKKGGTL